MSAVKCLIITSDLFKSIPLQFFNIVVKFRLLRALLYHSSFYLHMTPFFIWNLCIKGTTHVISNDTSCSIHNGAQLKALSDEECMINPSYYEISDYNWLLLNGVFYKANCDNFCLRYNVGNRLLTTFPFQGFMSYDRTHKHINKDYNFITTFFSSFSSFPPLSSFSLLLPSLKLYRTPPSSPSHPSLP